MVNGTTTRSPTFSFETPLPTSTTSPMFSWPRTVALFHGGLKAVEEMQVGSADRRRCDLDDDVARILDGGIGDRIDANIARAVPTERFPCALQNDSAVFEKTIATRRPCDRRHPAPQSVCRLYASDSGAACEPGDHSPSSARPSLRLACH